MRVRRFAGGNVMHSYDADSEACLNRQILNNYVKRKVMEDLCERTRRLIHSRFLKSDRETQLENPALKSVIEFVSFLM
jgi:hypothetical protein